jgi:hypothetical protein
MMIPPPETAISLAKRIHPLLAGQHPAVQGAALADLLATWLAGFEPDVREALLDNHVHTVRELVPINAAQMGRA